MKKVGNFTILDKKIGEGSFGTIHLCRLNGDPSRLLKPLKPNRAPACKIIKMEGLKANKKLMHYLESEIEVMNEVDTEHVLSLVDSKKSKNNIYLFFEYCNGGDLRNLLN